MNALCICNLHSKVLTSIMISGCMVLAGCMHVYFQVGMIIGDTEQHSNICGFCGGNGLHRWHMSRDCNVTSDDADNPNINVQEKK